MDAYRFAFIVCSNNKTYFETCRKFILNLQVPEGYSVDVIAMNGAESITEAYQSAMLSSEAKYKVYLHQDTFILKDTFIQECLDVFTAHSEIGLLGVIGADRLRRDGNIYKYWNLGGTLICNSEFLGITNFQPAFSMENERFVYAEAVDGMLMVTQYDLDWRKDILHGFDYYDVSQAMEFRRRGYRAAVLNSGNYGWTIHDCGYVTPFHIHSSKLAFCREYAAEGFQYGEKDMDNALISIWEEIPELVRNIRKMFDQGQYEEVEHMVLSLKQHSVVNTELNELLQVIQIDRLEKENGGNYILANRPDAETVLKKYLWVKLLLWEITYCVNSRAGDILLNALELGEISEIMIEIIGKHCLADAVLTADRIAAEGEKRYGK